MTIIIITAAVLATVAAAYRAKKAREAQARAFDWSTVRYDYNRGVAVKSGATY